MKWTLTNIGKQHYLCVSNITLKKKLDKFMSLIYNLDIFASMGR